jgi:hypothetical protein
MRKRKEPKALSGATPNAGTSRSGDDRLDPENKVDADALNDLR